MAIVLAAIILSFVVIAPTLTGLFLSGRGAVLRILGAVLVLPLVWFWVWMAPNIWLDRNVGSSNGWEQLEYLFNSFALGVVGALLGALGRARAAPPSD
ncbi:MAG: hypothetical protein ACK4VZ_14940 [Paracoccaceae bacterium]